MSVREIIVERDNAAELAHRRAGQLASVKAKMAAATQKSFCILLTQAGAFGAAMLTEQHRDMATGKIPSIGGVDDDAILGAALMIADVADIGGKEMSPYLGALGEGFFASFSVRKGQEAGIKAREQKKGGMAKVQGTGHQIGAGYGAEQYRAFLDNTAA
jgi:hypothetical protein